MPKYNSYDNIPAKVFFNILDSKNYQLLKPKPKEKGLEAVFMAIYDEWFIKTDNEEAKEYLTLRNELVVLQNKLNGVKAVLYHIYKNKHILTDEMYLQLCESIKKGFGIYVNTNTDFYDEMKRVLQSEVGCIKDDISFKEAELNDLVEKNKGKKFNYFAVVDSIANALAPRIINSDMLLAEFVEAEKSAIKKSLKNTA
jgi:hypothetical protein